MHVFPHLRLNPAGRTDVRPARMCGPRAAGCPGLVYPVESLGSIHKAYIDRSRVGLVIFNNFFQRIYAQVGRVV